MSGKNPTGKTNTSCPSLSLYFHIPFCKKKCPYCHFYVLPDKLLYHEQLLEALRLEWLSWQPIIDKKNITSIYFGGGTPSLFGPEKISKVLSWIDYDPAIEVTLEANPDDIVLQKFQDYHNAGINRVSIGVQTFDDALLKTIGRQHDSKKAIDAVRIVNKCEIKNISIDLMYDLPTQTLDNWAQSLNQVKSLPVSHLSLYNLTIEPHTVFHKYKNEVQKQMPTGTISTNMYKLAQKKLSEQGFEQYEISAFAKEGLISNHNIGYWTGRDFIGLGPSAYSFYEGKRFRNTANLSRYLKALKQNLSPVDFEEELPELNAQLELFVIALRIFKGVHLKQFQTKYGPLPQETYNQIQSLKNQGFLKEDHESLKLSEKGVLFYDHVASELI